MVTISIGYTHILHIGNKREDMYKMIQQFSPNIKILNVVFDFGGLVVPIGNFERLLK